MFRATLKSLLSRKLRLVLSGLAVVLGVMFVAGSFVLTDTLDRSFQDLFSNVYSNVDVQVTTKPKLAQAGGGSVTVPFPAKVVDTVKGVHGVKSAVGGVNGSARPIGKNGKVITTAGAPSFGVNWTGAGQEILREGRPPRADGEVVLNGSLAKTGKFAVGDQIGILTRQPKKMFTVVGVYGYKGNRDSMGGELGMAFTAPVAQQLLLDAPGVYSDITVTAAPGVPQTTLRDDVRAALGADYEVKTGTELAKGTTDQISKGLRFFNKILLGFAGVALFVGVFIILNTFSIIVAQRTRELALLRAMGASRGQVISSVVLEAVVIGLVASVIGLGAGIGVGALLANYFASSGGGLVLASIGVPASAVVSSFAVGVIVSVVAAVLPALRASRIAPVAAMREADTPDRPLTKQTVTGGITFALGAAALVVGLSGKAGGATLSWILGGILVAFVGVALLTPVISRPVVSVLGRLFSWSLPGKLGRRNSARNPRRTAITAAALMVGIALIIGVNVILTSMTKSLNKVANTQMKAELIIAGDQNTEVAATFDEAVLQRVAALPGVRTVAGIYEDTGSVNGKLGSVFAVNDAPALQRVMGLTAKEGVFGPLAAGQVIIDETTARDAKVHAGSTVRVQFAKGEQHTLTVAAIYAKTQTLRPGWIVSRADIKDFSVPKPMEAYIELAAGAKATDVQAKIEPLLADNPEVSVQDRSAYVQQQTSSLNNVLTMVQILLALAIIIAVLGVVNTLALSVIERTRELGLLRAIGLRRSQVMRMITVEAVVISVFGALLGIVVGTGLGAATVRALKNEGFTEYGFPWTLMVVYVLLAAVIGVVAAILPAIRAARLNVLSAIAYE